MTVKLNEPILTALGETQLKEKDSKDIITFKDIVGIALSQFRKKEDTKEDCYEKFKLSQKVINGKESLELNSEEAVLIKDCVHGIGYDNNTLGRVFEILEK